MRADRAVSRRLRDERRSRHSRPARRRVRDRFGRPVKRGV